MSSLIDERLTFSKCKTLARNKFLEARILFTNRKYSGAYYLAGYAIELALKASYCKTVQRYSFPPRKATYNQLYSHDINSLLQASGLEYRIQDDALADDNLSTAIVIVKDWNEKARYDTFQRKDAEALINAVEIVYTWIEKTW